MPFFLGIDGGGTKTHCVVGDEKSVLSRGSGSGCNIVRVGEACARDSLSAAIHEACVQAQVSPQQIARTCAGVAGAADDGIASLVQRILIEIVGGAIEVIGDMEVALENAFGGGPGVVVNAGTGAFAYGRNEQNETARAGGWGRVISDEGSAHWIGVQAIGAAFRTRDRGQQSVLLDKLVPALDARDMRDFVVRVNSDPLLEFATLFPEILAAAEEGDRDANDVLERAGRELSATADIVIGRLFKNTAGISVATHGGVFSGSPLVKSTFESALLANRPQVTFVNRRIDPALGALERARREFGVWHKKTTTL